VQPTHAWQLYRAKKEKYMKVRVLLAVSSIIFSSHALADYSAHQFHYMEMDLTQCKQIATDAAAKIGFSNVEFQDFSYGGDGRKFSVVYGMNEEGYSFQFACEPVKGFGYLIVNGPRREIRVKIRDELSNEITNASSKAK
jgi:hypothetical protein